MIPVEARYFGPFLLDIGIALLRSGASSTRTRITMLRFAAAYQFDLHLDMGAKSISLSLLSRDEKELFNGTKSASAQGVNFKVISGISRMSWSVTEKNWSLKEIRDELDRLLSLPHYQRFLTLFLVGVAGAAFCYTFGGNYIEMLITFGATFFGLFVKQELIRRSYNTYFCTYLSALVAALFTGAFYKAGTGLQLEHAFTTSVLFLIPGVPLINSFTDLIDGEILNGIDRGFNALIHALAIAFGLSTVMLIYNFHAR
jgi:uncharacterized membrane protein YjjP (DUF1212 family)